LFQIIDISKISPSIANIFKEFGFWKLQITGAQHLNRQIGPQPSRGKIADDLKTSPAWLICRLLPFVQSAALNKAFFTTRNIFVHVYLPLSILAKVILALHQETLDEDSMGIIQHVGKTNLFLDAGDKKACTGDLILETPMSNHLQDLAGIQSRAQPSEPSTQPAEVENILWKDIVLDKRPPFNSLFEKAKKIYIPFYPYWDIFDREGDNFKSELTCFWNIANLLNATTGTVDFLEKAIERWKTIDISPCPGLQTKKERQQEIETITQYKTARSIEPAGNSG
jgi:hypothetical protein